MLKDSFFIFTYYEKNKEFEKDRNCRRCFIFSVVAYRDAVEILFRFAYGC